MTCGSTPTTSISATAVRTTSPTSWTSWPTTNTPKPTCSRPETEAPLAPARGASSYPALVVAHGLAVGQQGAADFLKTELGMKRLRARVRRVGIDLACH